MRLAIADRQKPTMRDGRLSRFPDADDQAASASSVAVGTSEIVLSTCEAI